MMGNSLASYRNIHSAFRKKCFRVLAFKRVENYWIPKPETNMKGITLFMVCCKSLAQTIIGVLYTTRN